MSKAKEYINQDVQSWGYKPTFKDWLLGDSGWYIYHYLKHLRGVEYYSKYKHTFSIGGEKITLGITSDISGLAA